MIGRELHRVKRYHQNCASSTLAYGTEYAFAAGALAGAAVWAGLRMCGVDSSPLLNGVTALGITLGAGGCFVALSAHENIECDKYASTNPQIIRAAAHRMLEILQNGQQVQGVSEKRAQRLLARAQELEAAVGAGA